MTLEDLEDLAYRAAHELACAMAEVQGTGPDVPVDSTATVMFPVPVRTPRGPRQIDVKHETKLAKALRIAAMQDEISR